MQHLCCIHPFPTFGCTVVKYVVPSKTQQLLQECSAWIVVAANWPFFLMKHHNMVLVVVHFRIMSFQIPSVWFMTCWTAINAWAMSNDDGASIGYIECLRCDIAHVLEMRRGKRNMASSEGDARSLRMSSSMVNIGWIRQSTKCVVVLLFARHWCDCAVNWTICIHKKGPQQLLNNHAQFPDLLSKLLPWEHLQHACEC